MKPCVFLFVLAMLLHGTSAMTHSLKYFYTASSGIKNFPEFVTVGMVNDIVFTHYDSNIQREVPKQDWMHKVIEGDPQYSDRNTQIYLGTQPVYINNIEVAKKRFNQTGGVHIYQKMYGCEWDDETNKVTGYRQYSYDGEDFLVWDTETNTWIAPKQQAFITKERWNSDKAELEYRKAYLTQECPEWLKKYVGYGKSTLMRKELPTISILQKSSSSPVTCHATGFYPDAAMMFWTKDGEDVTEGVDPGEILPNHDGTFQKSVELDVSSVDSGDWDRYSCVFQLSGVKEDIYTKLDKAVIKTNEKSNTPIIIAAVVVVLCLAAVAALGVFVYMKKKNDKRPPSPVDDAGVTEELRPKNGGTD